MAVRGRERLISIIECCKHYFDIFGILHKQSVYTREEKREHVQLISGDDIQLGYIKTLLHKKTSHTHTHNSYAVCVCCTTSQNASLLSVNFIIFSLHFFHLMLSPSSVISLCVCVCFCTFLRLHIIRQNNCICARHSCHAASKFS